MAKPSSSLWNWGTFLVKVTVTASLLGWVFRQFDLAESLAHLQAIPPAVILLAFALTLLVIGMGAFRWQLLLRSVQIHLPLRAICTISFISNFFNSFLPSRMGGEVARFYYLNKLTGRPAELILSMVMDRCIGVVALMSVPFLVMPMYQPTGWLSEAVGLVYVVVSAVLILGIALGHLFNRGRPPLQAMPRPTRLHALLDSLGRFLQLYAEQKGILLQVLGVAVTSHILNIGIYFGLGAALGEGHRALEFFFFLPMVILATLLPLSLGGHGIREWTFVSIFTTLGMPRQTALSISLLSLLVKISASLVGAALYLTYGRSRHG